jgi:hypothetical protein
MRFKWEETPVWGDAHRPAWTLYLMDKNRRVGVMGSLLELPRAFRIREHRTGDMYWLDKDLSLAPSQRVEEAQRAAKLFLCVGRDYMEKRT